ncbi:MAG TPA: protein-glutamine glutaminase family protein [Thermoanaerobaculia bacterium]
MPNENAIVTTVRRIEGDFTVELEDGLRVRLDPENRFSEGYFQVLHGMLEQGLPVYLELDPTRELITRLRIPYITRVVGLRDGEDGLDVELEFSHARHVLRRGVPGYDEMEQELRDSLATGEVVAVSETDDHEIIDVRPYTPLSDVSSPLAPRRQLQRRPWQRLIDWWRSKGQPCVSPARAQKLFDAVALQSCNPSAIRPPCIPFRYPDDGCWARAHAMCRTMIDMGALPGKVWIQAVQPGRLRVVTPNNPKCYVEWPWHVAPTICVKIGRVRREMVIDPSIFTTLATVDEWVAAQNHPRTTLTPSDWRIYYLWGGYVDPLYILTARDLTIYRLQLQLRTLTVGPPPYPYCP